MDFRYRKLEIIRTNNAVYTRVWPYIGASYNHLLHEYNLIQCSSRCEYKRNHITTSELLQEGTYLSPSCSPSPAVLARFFSFMETDDGARLLLLEGGAGVVCGLVRCVERVLGMVVAA